MIWCASLTCALSIASARTQTIELPEGPLARAVQALAPDTQPAVPPANFGRRGEAAWNRPGTWARWAALVDAESKSNAPDPARRAELALLALEQERWDDAWRDVEACAGTPSWLAALLPRFLPGAPAGSPASTGGRAGNLPDGVTLSPSLPPSSQEAPPGRVERRAMTSHEVQIGEAVVDIKVAVESEGVQIDITHRSGGAAKFLVRIPEPEEFAIAQEYVDWYRQDVTRIAHEIAVAPGDDTHTLYGRFEPRAVRLSAQLPARLSAQLQSGTLWIVAGETAEDRALAREIAESLGSGPLRIAARVLAAGEAPPKAEWTGVRLDLRDSSERERKLAWLASSVEHFALRVKEDRPR